MNRKQQTVIWVLSGFETGSGLSLGSELDSGSGLDLVSLMGLAYEY